MCGKGKGSKVQDGRTTELEKSEDRKRLKFITEPGAGLKVRKHHSRQPRAKAGRSHNSK